jgi:hypothetical protein
LCRDQTSCHDQTFEGLVVGSVLRSTADEYDDGSFSHVARALRNGLARVSASILSGGASQRRQPPARGRRAADKSEAVAGILKKLDYQSSVPESGPEGQTANALRVAPVAGSQETLWQHHSGEGLNDESAFTSLPRGNENARVCFSFSLNRG